MTDGYLAPDKMLKDGRLASLLELMGGRARIVVGMSLLAYDQGW